MVLIQFPQTETAHGSGRARLGDYLCARGTLNQEQLRLALHEQKIAHELLGKVLVRLRFAHERDVLEGLAMQTGHPAVQLSDHIPEPDALGLWGEATARQLNAVPLSLADGALNVALADPFDVRTLDQLRRFCPPGITMRLHLAAESDLQAFIVRAYGQTRNLQHWLSELGQQLVTQKDQPIIEAIDALLEQAVMAGASDIHLEPEAQSVRVRIRVDGILQLMNLLHREHWPMLAQRLKVQAGMDIVDTRNIQDGRFNKVIAGQEIDFRVSILPTLHGENIVIRILDQRRALLPIEKLGFTPQQQTLLRRLCMKPEGMLVITGPTGSGKTTTLYALLQLLDSGGRNIMTLEDPVEYQLDHIRQTQVREQHNLSFADGVRAILRQDPDTVLIGEIRDPDTAQMGLRAAMTGSQVFSTLHTQSCFGVFPRLREFGISPGLMVGNIMATVAQRLVRQLCPSCRRLMPADSEECRYLHMEGTTPPLVGRAVGCVECNHTGYKGRVVVCEILPLDAELDDLVGQGAPRTVLEKAARQKGFISLAEDGVHKMREGLISLQSLMAEVDITPSAGRH